MMDNSYTEQMENALFQQWDEFDDYNEDYSTLIEKLNSAGSFRSFGDGLLFFLQKRLPDLTAETAVKYIETLCAESGVARSDIARSDNTLILSKPKMKLKQLVIFMNPYRCLMTI